MPTRNILSRPDTRNGVALDQGTQYPDFACHTTLLRFHPQIDLPNTSAHPFLLENYFRQE